MTCQAKYRVLLDQTCIRIHTRSYNELGYVELPCEGYPVRHPDGELIAVVNSIADALPTLIDYWEKEKRRSGAYAFLPLTR